MNMGHMVWGDARRDMPLLSGKGAFGGSWSADRPIRLGPQAVKAQSAALRSAAQAFLAQLTGRSSGSGDPRDDVALFAAECALGWGLGSAGTICQAGRGWFTV